MTTITFDPSSLSFGNVTTGDAPSLALTITSSSDQTVSLTLAGAGFTVSPSSPIVPAQTHPAPNRADLTPQPLPGVVVVTVTFSPTAAQSYTGTITGADGSTCNLSGAGVTPTPVADPNQFMSESGTTATAGDKYFEIAVPDFALNGSGTNAGNSFVRLGVFPSSADDSPGFQNSLKLASLVGDPALIQAAEAPPTLDVANLLSDPAALTQAGGPGPNLDTVPTVPGSFSDGSGIQTTGYGGAGDPDYLLGFADDTRVRGPSDDGTMSVNTLAPQTLLAGQVVSNTAANRQQETLSLLTKGGWWDHSDGNRVTTTAGDKIEIIQGNYKLVVLGRQALPAQARQSKGDTNYSNLVDNAFITDVSGGHFQEQYPSPTPCIKTIEYSQDDTGEWTLYQDNSIGQLITKLKGRTVDLFQGASRDSYVGLDPSDSAPISGSAIVSDANAWVPDTSLDPVITSKTWAQRIMTYVGSVGKPVPEILTLTFADAVQDSKFVTGDVLSSTSAATVVNVTTAVTVGNLYLAPLTVELTAGFKLQLQPVLLGVNMNKTRIVGDNTTVNGANTIATLTESDVTAIRSSIGQLKTDVTMDQNTICDTFLSLAQDKISLADAELQLSEIIVQGV